MYHPGGADGEAWTVFSISVVTAAPPLHARGQGCRVLKHTAVASTRIPPPTHARAHPPFCVALYCISYLGDRRCFLRDVAKPVRAALSSDGDGRSTVEGLQELEKLHKQVRTSTFSVDDVVFFCSSFDPRFLYFHAFVVCAFQCLVPFLV